LTTPDREVLLFITAGPAGEYVCVAVDLTELAFSYFRESRILGVGFVK